MLYWISDWLFLLANIDRGSRLASIYRESYILIFFTIGAKILKLFAFSSLAKSSDRLLIFDILVPGAGANSRNPRADTKNTRKSIFDHRPWTIHIRNPMQDKQSERDRRGIRIDRVGVKGLVGNLPRRWRLVYRTCLPRL